MQIEDGIHVYIGTTGTGKTHLAIRHAIELARSKSLGVLVIDSRGAQNLKEIPLYREGKDLYSDLFNYGKIVRVVPENADEFDRIMKTLDRVGNAVVLIDEVSEWATNLTFNKLCRVWRHRTISFFITTQKIGRDVEQTVLACDPNIYIFRLTNPRSLEWVERWHRLSEAQIKALQVGQYYRARF